jgi:hypothetical protein
MDTILEYYPSKDFSEFEYYFKFEVDADDVQKRGRPFHSNVSGAAIEREEIPVGACDAENWLDLVSMICHSWNQCMSGIHRVPPAAPAAKWK